MQTQIATDVKRRQMRVHMRIDDLQGINAQQTEVAQVQPLSVGIHDRLDLVRCEFTRR